jgi:hypothetical protein
MSQREGGEFQLPAMREFIQPKEIHLGVSDESSVAKPMSPATDAIPADQQVELDELSRGIINTHRELTVLAVCSTAKALQIGAYVQQAKRILDHGQFQLWVEKEVTPHCGLALRTVQRYSKLARESSDLLKRIQQLSQLENGSRIEFAEAEQLLNSMPISQAMNLLQCRKLKSPNTLGKPDVFVSSCQQAGEQFFASANAPYVAYLEWELKDKKSLIGYQFLSTSGARENRNVVQAAVKAHRDGELDEALLLLCGGGSQNWLHQLDEFPRVLLRQSPSDDGSAAGLTSGKQFLFGLIGRDRFADFNDAFDSLGAVLVPFTE